MDSPRYLDNVVWELTLKCNARCEHCGSAAGVDRKDNLSNEEIFRICDELAAAGCLKVTLIGGEAFLHPAWRQILQKLHSLNIETAIVTNAFALNDEKIRFLAENGVKTLGISLDGITAEKHDSIRRMPGMYNKIFSLTESFQKYKIPCIAITTLTKKNLFDLPRFYQELPHTFFKAWQIQIGISFGRLAAESTLNELEYYIAGLFIALSRLRFADSPFNVWGMHDFGYYSKLIPTDVNIYNRNWHGCPAGKHSLGIRSNGKVVGCLSIYNDNFIEADLRQQSVSEIWSSADFCGWNRKENKFQNLQGYCRECPYAIACCAGCSATAIALTDSPDYTPLCFHYFEKKYEQYKGDDSYSRFCRQIVNGQISPDGTFILENGTKVTADMLPEIADDYYRQLLSLLA